MVQEVVHKTMFCEITVARVYARAQACVRAYTRTTSAEEREELESLQVLMKKRGVRLVSSKKACEVATAQCVP